MNHFYTQITEESYFSFEDLYSRMAERFPSGSTFVELGVLHGKSLAFLIVEVLNRGKNVGVVGVDNFHWSLNQKATVHRNLLPVAGKYELVEDGSNFAATGFADESVDFLFIDACHDYESVKADIAAWLPKMRPDGVMGGHDYDEGSFPGVVRAVDEAFGKRVKFSPHTCWEVDL